MLLIILIYNIDIITILGYTISQQIQMYGAT
jgi:hypothetical protein